MRSRIVLFRLIDPDVLEPAVMVIVVSISLPFLSDPGKFRFNSKSVASEEVNS